MITFLPPFLEVSKELLTEHGSNSESSSELIFGQESSFTINIVLPCVLDSNIDILFDSNVKRHIFHLLGVLAECIETVLQDKSAISLAKLNSRHIGLHQVPIVMDIVLPGLYH